MKRIRENEEDKSVLAIIDKIKAKYAKYKFNESGPLYKRAILQSQLFDSA